MTQGLTVDGARIEYLARGSGSAVVFVHGALADHRVALPVLDLLAATHRAIAFDQRYFGHAEWTDQGRYFTAAGHALDLVRLIETLEAAPAHVIGWGYGAAVATSALRARPELFRSLILHDPTIPSVIDTTARDQQAVRSMQDSMARAIDIARSGDAPQAARMLVESIMGITDSQFASETTSVQREIIETNARTLPLQLAVPMAPITRGDFMALARSGLPMLITRAEHSSRYYHAVVDAMRETVPTVTVAELPGANHWAPMTHPDQFGRIVLSFIDSVDAASGAGLADG